MIVRDGGRDFRLTVLGTESVDGHYQRVACEDGGHPNRRTIQQPAAGLRGAVG